MSTIGPERPTTPDPRLTQPGAGEPSLVTHEAAPPAPRHGAGAEPPPVVPPTEPASRGRSNRLLYWIVAAVVVVLVIVGLAAYSEAKTNKEAQQKAEQLVSQFEKAGLPVPSDLDDITRSLGTDGGAVCDNPANALGKAILNDLMTNGADFVGRRPVIVDRRILLGEALILQTYCPDKLKPYQDKILKLKTADTVKQ